MKVKDWLNANGSFFVERDAHFLAKDVFKKDLTSLLVDGDRVLGEETITYLQRVKTAYRQGMPLPYILDKEDFYGRQFYINNTVLIPRKETELIVERAAEIILRDNFCSVLDLGCGSGVIAISIKKIVPKKVFVVASDISLLALAVTQKNACIHDADIQVVAMNLLEGFRKEAFDMIVSNPPYVESSAIKGGLLYEPRIALDAGENGLDYIKNIIQNAGYYLKRGGYIIMEVGYKHKKDIEVLIENMIIYDIVSWIQDYDRHWRGVVIKKRDSFVNNVHDYS